MIKKINIGASISSRTDASSTVESIFSAGDFPCTLNIENHTVTRLVLPELKGLDIPGLAATDAHFTDIGLLKRLVSSLAQISRLNQFSVMATISIPGPLELENDQKEHAQDSLQTSETGTPSNVLGAGQTTSTDDIEQITATVIQELPGGVLLLAVDGVQFEVKKNQLRENGTLTAGGYAAYKAAKDTINE